jgi:hypothetical protein
MLCRDKVTLHDDDVHFALDHHAYLDCYSAKVAIRGRHISPLGYIIQSVLAVFPYKKH